MCSCCSQLYNFSTEGEKFVRKGQQHIRGVAGRNEREGNENGRPAGAVRGNESNGDLINKYILYNKN